MNKKNDKKADESVHQISKKTYNDILYKLQIELVKLQRHLIKEGDKVLIIFEGRDAAERMARSSASFAISAPARYA